MVKLPVTAAPRRPCQPGLSSHSRVYHVGSGDGTGAGAVMALNPTSGDVYLVGQNGARTGAVVSMSTASSHGAVWSSLTGNGALMLNQSEYVNTIAIDPATHSAVVGTEGHIFVPGTSHAIYRLTNADVIECPLCTATHHWRPWVYGLPNESQIVKWVAGQYENGVFYYYAATWGRGIWKREARGGDF